MQTWLQAAKRWLNKTDTVLDERMYEAVWCLLRHLETLEAAASAKETPLEPSSAPTTGLAEKHLAWSTETLAVITVSLEEALPPSLQTEPTSASSRSTSSITDELGLVDQRIRSDLSRMQQLISQLPTQFGVTSHGLLGPASPDPAGGAAKSPDHGGFTHWTAP